MCYTPKSVNSDLVSVLVFPSLGNVIYAKATVFCWVLDQRTEPLVNNNANATKPSPITNILFLFVHYSCLLTFPM